MGLSWIRASYLTLRHFCLIGVVLQMYILDGGDAQAQLSKSPREASFFVHPYHDQIGGRWRAPPPPPPPSSRLFFLFRKTSA